FQLLLICFGYELELNAWSKIKDRDFFVKKSNECTANTIKSNRQTFKSKLIFVFYRKSLLESKNRLSDKAISLLPF
ncbi:MAG: hypothetical protein Q7U47_11730, partial [Paludibacter sp.]|nr:hypothetical protein [Paludibacter sp.]